MILTIILYSKFNNNCNKFYKIKNKMKFGGIIEALEGIIANY